MPWLIHEDHDDNNSVINIPQGNHRRNIPDNEKKILLDDQYHATFLTDPLCRSSKKQYRGRNPTILLLVWLLSRARNTKHDRSSTTLILLMKSSQTLRIDHLLVSSRTVLSSIFAAATIVRRTFSRCPFSDSPNSRRSSLTVKRIFSSRLKIFIREGYRKLSICPLYQVESFARRKAVNF